MILSFLCSNVSGAPLPDIDVNSFSTIFKSGTENVSGYITSLSSQTSGFYAIEISDSLPKGSYLIALVHPSYYISPDFYSVEKTDSYSIDEIYSILYSSTVSPVILSSSDRYGSLSYNIIDNDSLYETVQIPTRYLPVTSWSNWTIGGQYFDATSQSFVNISGGTQSATITDSSLGLVRIILDECLNIIDYNSNETTKTAYFQLQGHDALNYRRTVLEITLNISRDFNRVT
jgi:hypothetical protein